MRLLIDFQACQGESRNRGIGRYAFGLLKALAISGKLADVTLHVNTTITGKNDPLLEEIFSLSPKTHVVCESYFPIDTSDREKNKELNIIKLLNIAQNYEGIFFLDPMNVSNVNVTLSSKNSLPNSIWCGAVLYDLIPLVYKDFYLTNHIISQQYNRQLQLIRNCNCLLSISEHTKRDAIDLLNISHNRITNINGGIEDIFKKAQHTKSELKYMGIEKKFVMYLGGVDFRKNMFAAIEAFALLPNNLKSNLQLVIVCAIDENTKYQIKNNAYNAGISENSLVLTGFISDEILVKLYNAASLFIFPSLYEGLGLPIVEAIRCGTPVLAGDNSSQPEAVGTEDALFDASSPQSIAEKIEYALNNPKWIKELKERQRRHADNFTWEKTAEKAWAAIEKNFAEFRKNKCTTLISSRPKIAWFTPLPPQETGIANYNASLIPHLMQDFNIDLVIDSGYSADDDYLSANCSILSTGEFEAKYSLRTYDQCVYQIGNSPFHTYMFPFIEKYGGAVVLHEVYMDGIARFLDSQNSINGSFLLNAYLYAPELARQKELFHVDSAEYSHIRTIALLSHILNSTDGVLVHSKHACNMLQEIMPVHSCPITVSEHGASLPILLLESEKKQLKSKLGIEDGKIICSTFGNIQRFKGIEDIIEALFQLSPEMKRKIVFFFVGSCHEFNLKWFDELISKASLAGLDMRKTGYLDDKFFLDYINVSDVALSLRTFSRGESSGALLHLLSRGIPAIVYDIGFFSEIDDNAVLKIPLSDTEALKNQIERLITNEELRKTASKHARDFASRLHWPTRVEGYRDLIYKSIEYKARVKKYAGIMYSANSEAIQLLTGDFSY